MLRDISSVGDNADLVSDVSVTTPTLPADEGHDPTEDARAALECDTVNPRAVEQETDDTAEMLVENLPADASIRLAHHDILQRIGGQWERTQGWVASVITPDGKINLSENGARPLTAAERLVNSYRRAVRVTRQKAEYRPLRDADEALGVIDPHTLDDLRDRAEHMIGRADWIVVDAEGRVTVAPQHLPIHDPGEAYHLGQIIHQHVAATARLKAEPATAA